MDYTQLLAALQQDSAQKIAANPYLTGAQEIGSLSPFKAGNSSAKNIGQAALQGLLSGLGGSMGKARYEQEIGDRNTALSGFFSAPEQQQAELLKGEQLKPFSGFLSAINDEQRRATKLQTQKDDADLKKSVMTEYLKGRPAAAAKMLGISDSGGMSGPVGEYDISDEERYKRIKDLRNELTGLPEYKNYSVILNQAQNIKALAKRDDPQSNLGLIYSTIKLIDPASAVKEGEVDMVALAQGPLSSWSGDIKQATETGGRLSADTRRRLVEMADIVAKNAEAQYKAQEKPRVAIGDRMKAIREDLGILPDYQPVGVELTQQAPPPGGSSIMKLPGETPAQWRQRMMGGG